MTVNKVQLSRILMIATILLVAAFQAYWLKNLYKDEKQGLRKEADILFRETIYKLQMRKFDDDSLFTKIANTNPMLIEAVNLVRQKAGTTDKKESSDMSVTISRSIKTSDTIKREAGRIFISGGSLAGKNKIPPFGGMHDRGPDASPPIFLSSLGDSISIQQIDSMYKTELKKSGIDVSYKVTSVPIKDNKLSLLDSLYPSPFPTRYIAVGLANPVAYRAELQNETGYLLGKIAYPILVSLLLIGITTLSFIFLYRNLVAQRRLTEVKNEFISNITHELKTPIATVNVAIEALKNFNAIDNPQRTREYLDISSAELQRLSLLVDKVLKLSLFENKEIELRKEPFDLRQLTEEVIRTMQLQLQKKKASLQFNTEGENFIIEADKLHITSVIYNLLDNALKYSPENPVITILLAEKRNTIALQVSDNGIGIPAAYKDKIFEKFFRVPHGNTHNIKGYGLGLSYVHHVIEKHKGSIEVVSEENKGTTFTVNLLKEL